MKKIIYLFIVLGTLSVTAQTKKKTVAKKATTTAVVKKPEGKKIFIAKNDIEFKDGMTFFTFTDLYVEDAATNLYPVELSILANESEFVDAGMTSTKLNSMLVTAYYNAMYQADDKSTFKAKSITILYMAKYEAWTLNVVFTSKDSTGVSNESKFYTCYDKTGSKELKASELTEKK